MTAPARSGEPGLATGQGGKKTASDARPDGPGFTLLEILVAALILAIALVTIESSILGMQDGMLRSMDAVLAARLASDKLAEIEIAGVRNLREKEGDLSPDHPGWRFRVETESSGFGALALTAVSVYPPEAAQPALTLEKLVYER